MGRHRRTRNSRGATPVRVIAGSLKGRVLGYPPAREVRPTMQRTRASIFDSLGTRVRGAVFVDLFAAAGGMGIEAASRGAAFVHFVENSGPAVRALKENLERCGLGSGSCAVHAVDVFEFLESGDPADFAGAIVFADPPYGEGAASKVLESLDRNGYHEIGLLMLEHEGALCVEHETLFAVVKSARFGQTRVSFLTSTGGRY